MDGNWGGCAGIAEMFLQSHAGFINILPALPDRFSEGSFAGLRVRGNGVISARWKDKKLTEATLTAQDEGEFKLKIPGYVNRLEACINGKSLPDSEKDNYLTVTLRKGDILVLKFH